MSKMPRLNFKRNKIEAHRSMNFSNDNHKFDIYTQKDFFTVLERERERANRNKHQFSLIVFEFGLPVTDQTKTINLLKKIWKRLRIIDEIGWYGSNRIGIILPYTSKQGAWQLTKCLSDLNDSSVLISTCTICTYPPGCDADINEHKNNK